MIRARSVGLRGVALTFLAALVACSGPGPARGPCSAKGPLGSVCGFENPEDVAFSAASGDLIASEMKRDGKGGFLVTLVPGASAPRRLWPTGAAADFAPRPTAGDASCPRPDPAELGPHGIALDAAGRLWAVNHGGRESIEILQLEGAGDALRATWIGCVLLPEGTAANDLAPDPAGGVYASNFAPSLDSTWAMLKLGVGAETGDVLHWTPAAGWTHVPGSGASGANGVALSPDGKFLFYAETGRGRVVRLGLADGSRASVPTPRMPDNLSWTAAGTLLVPSHRSGLGLISCGRGGDCRAPWTLYEIDPQTLQSSEVLAHDGDVIGAVSSATETPDGIYLGAVFGDRVGVFKR
jgi:hypothetical protein